jgi:hypothetical protein
VSLLRQLVRANPKNMRHMDRIRGYASLALFLRQKTAIMGTRSPPWSVLV